MRQSTFPTRRFPHHLPRFVHRAVRVHATRQPGTHPHAGGRRRSRRPTALFSDCRRSHSMSSQIVTRNALAALMAGVIAAIIYEVIYFLTSDHHVRSGLSAAALIGVITLVIAFVLGLIFRQIFNNRS